MSFATVPRTQPPTADADWMVVHADGRSRAVGLSRAERLQALARGDEGFLLALGYSTQRGFGRTHPFAGEVRVGEVEVEFDAPDLGFAVPLGRLEVTECQMINQFTGSADAPAQFTRGYGLVFGRGERKALSMSLVDRALRHDEFDERVVAPAQDEEFVVSHAWTRCRPTAMQTWPACMKLPNAPAAAASAGSTSPSTTRALLPPSSADAITLPDYDAVDVRG